jgi:hypothetical protein
VELKIDHDCAVVPQVAHDSRLVYEKLGENTRS